MGNDPQMVIQMPCATNLHVWHLSVTCMEDYTRDVISHVHIQITRMHSSRMRTARLLTVSCNARGWGVCPTPLDAETPPGVDPPDADPSPDADPLDADPSGCRPPR